MTTHSTEAGSPLQRVTEHLHLLMWRAKLPQAEVARRLGITQTTVSRKLRGQVPLTLEEFLVICDMLGVEPAQLLGDLLPRLDSNQQPFGYPSSQVSGGARPRLQLVV